MFIKVWSGDREACCPTNYQVVIYHNLTRSFDAAISSAEIGKDICKLQVVKGEIKIAELIKLLSIFLIYIVLGYCYNTAYNFVSLKEYKKEAKHLLSSLIVGSVICGAALLIPVHILRLIGFPGLIFISLVSGTVLGKISTSKLLIKILDILHIHRSPNQCVWLDVMSPDLPMRVKVTMKSGYVYTGCIYVMEEHSSRPPMALYTYKISKDGVVVDDKTDCPNQALLIELADAEYIEVIYDENSVVCKDIIRYVDYVKGITSVESKKCDESTLPKIKPYDLDLMIGNNDN